MLLKSNLEANFCTGTYLNLAKIKALNRCAKRKNGCKILQSLKINKVLGYKALEKSKDDQVINYGCDQKKFIREEPNPCTITEEEENAP